MRDQKRHAERQPPSRTVRSIVLRPMGKGGSGHSHAAVIDDILDVRTINDTRNGAADNAFWVSGLAAVSTCRNPDSECMVRLLAIARPAIRLVPVVVEASDG